MELEKANHVITAVMAMLNDLVQQGVIGFAKVDILLPVIVNIVFKNETIEVPPE